MLAHLALAVAPILAASSIPTPHTFTALAPVEIWGSRLGDLRGIAVDAEGRVWVADHAGGRILKIDAPGSVRVAADGLRRPVGVAFDRGGGLLVAEEDAGRIVQVAPSGQTAVVATGLERPRWLAVGDDDTIYVSARRSAAERRDDDDGRGRDGLVLALRPGERPAVVVHGLRDPEGVAVRDGMLYVASRSVAPGDHHPLVKVPLASAGVREPVALGDGSIRKPVGLALDADGTVFLTATRLALPDDHVAGVVAKIDQAGDADAFAAGADEPQGLAFDHDGNLYLTEAHGGRVVRFLAPRPPVLDPLPAWTRASSLTLTGRAEPEARVEARTADVIVHTLVADSGRFALALGLRPNALDRIDVRAIGHDGAGLVSPSVSVDVTQDVQPPGLVFDSPPTGATVRGNVPVRATAADAGSQVAGLQLLANGQPLAAATSPSLPAPATSISADWDSALSTDGVSTLAARASDRAGNTIGVSRVVTVDNTPPETQLAGPETVSDGLRFTLSGTDNLTPVSELQFSWRLDGSPWSTFSAETAITLASVAPGSHTFEAKARDRAGNEDTTPAALTFSPAPGGLGIAIVEPAAGARVSAGGVVVRGTVELAGGELGVTVNGAPAWLRDGSFTALVPLAPDATSLVASAVAADGRTGRTEIPIAMDTTAPAFLTARPASGVAPLTVRLSVSRDSATTSVELDADGDGIADYTGETLDDHPVVYTTPGVYTARATVIDAGGGRRSAAAVIQVFDLAALDGLLRATWTAMKDALRRGDIAAGVSHIVQRRRADYQTAFVLLSANLGAIDSILPDVRLVKVRDAAAIYEMRRVDEGLLRSFEVRFAIDGDGLWRVEAF